MPKAAFTDRSVKGLQARPGRTRDVYWDKSLPGFCVRISGAKRAFYCTYRLHGRFVWYRIAEVSQSTGPSGLAAARAIARTTMGRADAGQDPAAEKAAKRQAAIERRSAVTFDALCDQFIEDREEGEKIGATTAAEYRRMTKAYIVGKPLTRKPAGEVTSADLEGLLKGLARKAPVQANRLFQFVRAVCRWGRKKGKLDANAMDAVDRPKKERTRERVLSDSDIACLYLALDGNAEKPDQFPAAPAPVKAAVKALLLLGQRATETLEMRWSDLALGADVPLWSIPGQFRKGGEPHAVPLPAGVVSMLKALPRQGERVFEGVSVTNMERDWWRAIRERAIAAGTEREAAVEHFTIHDLRRTCMSGMTRAGITRFIADRVVGHKQAGVAAIYDRYEYLNEKHAALSTWGRHVEAIITGDKGKLLEFPAGRA